MYIIFLLISIFALSIEGMEKRERSVTEIEIVSKKGLEGLFTKKTTIEGQLADLESGKKNKTDLDFDKISIIPEVVAEWLGDIPQFARLDKAQLKAVLISMRSKKSESYKSIEKNILEKTAIRFGKKEKSAEDAMPSVFLDIMNGITEKLQSNVKLKNIFLIGATLATLALGAYSTFAGVTCE